MDANNKKNCCKMSICEIILLILGYTLLISGCILIIENEDKNDFKKMSLTVIYTSYENDICLFETDCFNINFDNGCRKYYTLDNEFNFDCTYLNVVLGKGDNNEMLCGLNHFENGFYYPEFGEVWYNSTYTDLYKLVNVGDTIDVWYNNKKGECILDHDYDRSKYATGIILLVIGLIVVLSNIGNHRKKIHNYDDGYKRKSTNFVNIEQV